MQTTAELKRTNGAASELKHSLGPDELFPCFDRLQEYLDKDASVAKIDNQYWIVMRDSMGRTHGIACGNTVREMFVNLIMNDA